MKNEQKNKPKKICHVCSKEKKPYTVILRNNALDMITYLSAREKGEICKRCDIYHAMTGAFKDATDKEFKDAEIARDFANMMFKWWTKDDKIYSGDRYENNKANKRDWEGTAGISEWAREYLSKK